MSWYDDIANDDSEHGRVETLLANLLRTSGEVPMSEERFDYTHAGISVPGADLYGSDTTYLNGYEVAEFDFTEGVAFEGSREVAQFGTIDDLSRAYESHTSYLRSAAIWADQTVSVSFSDKSDYYTIEGGNWVQFPDQRFQRLYVKSDDHARIKLAASPRSTPPVDYDDDTALIRRADLGHFKNKGSHTSYADVGFQIPEAASDNADKYTGQLFTHQYDRTTIILRNDAASGDNVDFRIRVGGGGGTDAGYAFDLDEVTGVAPGDVVKFVIDEPHESIYADWKTASGLSSNINGAVTSR